MSAATLIATMTDQNQGIAATVASEQARLRRFIRRHVVDHGDAEDILQEVFYELVDAYRLMQPIEQAGAWLMRVARNRIIDRFRRRQRQPLTESMLSNDDAMLNLDELLPSPEAGPEALLARELLLEQIEAAIAELPPLQRQIFVAHELEGRSFKQLSIELGVGINTLLSRKHEAVLALRERLNDLYLELEESSGEQP